MQKIVDEFFGVCKSRKLKMSASKNKVLELVRAEVKLIDFVTPYRVRMSNGTANGRSDEV